MSSGNSGGPTGSLLRDRRARGRRRPSPVSARDRHDLDAGLRTATTPRSPAAARACATRSTLLSPMITGCLRRGTGRAPRRRPRRAGRAAGRACRSRRRAAARRRHRRRPRARRRACSGAAGPGRPARPACRRTRSAHGPGASPGSSIVWTPRMRSRVVCGFGRHRDQVAAEDAVEQRRLADVRQADDRAEARSDLGYSWGRVVHGQPCSTKTRAVTHRTVASSHGPDRPRARVRRDAGGRPPCPRPLPRGRPRHLGHRDRLSRSAGGARRVRCGSPRRPRSRSGASGCCSVRARIAVALAAIDRIGHLIG